MATATLQKSLGAFYTGESAAERLVAWAVSDGSQTVLDPSCGAGVFLAAAYSRLRLLGSSSPKVCGVDVSEDALRLARERVGSADLIHSDFFKLAPSSLRSFDCIVGNPPFIRYQTFNGDKNSLGHERATEAGVELPRLASSWAPFVVHASRFLHPGGRLAMVMPVELGHAKYAREVLRYLADNFRHIAVEMFRGKLFEDLSQSTVLLFCEGYGEAARSFIMATADDLQGSNRHTSKVDIAMVKSGCFRFNQCLVSDQVRSLYDGLAADKRVERLGSVADVGIGYVTGANDFFHLSAQEVSDWEIPKQFLRPCLLNLRVFQELEFTHQHWKNKRVNGEKTYLLALPSVPAETLPSNVRAYLHHGKQNGFHERYKCRVRAFWHAVPHVRIADAFLSYMSGEQPILVANASNLVAPNTVHILRFSRACNPLHYAASWRSSLTRLSCELEGHALGGGLFKMEPSEAENVLVVRAQTALFRNLVAQLKESAVTSFDRYADTVDRYVLRRFLGLTKAECALLRDAAAKIESWRKHK